MNPDEMNEFFTLMNELDGGVPLQELLGAMREVLVASAAMGGKGEVSVKLSFHTKLTGKTPKTVVVADVSKKVPKMPLGSGQYFCGAGGVLLRDDPAQLELELEGKTISISSRRGARGAAAASGE